MKKILLIFSLIFICFLTGCKKPHEHSETFWKYDKSNHWSECFECGEKIAIEKHNLSENCCTICNIEVAVSKDGSYTLTIFNNKNQKIKIIYYSNNDIVRFEEHFEYDSTGNVQKISEIAEGIVISEKYYTTIQKGDETYTYNSQIINYFSSGAKVVTIIDMYENIETLTSYDEFGKIDYTEQYNSTYDEFGNRTYFLLKINDERAQEVSYSYNVERKLYKYQEKVYHEDKTITFYQYNEKGEIIFQLTYDE
ncbi:MAG: hypothetical protein IJX78_01530 [Bacilli bacterium]|nr:hypothetical protein [Bacilli bacterium]